MSHLRCTGLTKTYVTGDRSVTVLANLSFEIPFGRVVSLFGANGCGKTTLLNAIAGLISLDSGNVEIGTNRNPTIGYVWQDYRSSLLPWLDARDNVGLPLRLHGIAPQAARARAETMLRENGAVFPATEWVYRLSGGQQQLICLLRSIVARPSLLLLDEPLAALDHHMKWSMTAALGKVWDQHPMTTLFVSHDVDEAVMVADEVWLMSRHAHTIVKKVVNGLPRPRRATMLTAPEHLTCRAEVIEFLMGEATLDNEDKW